MKLIVYTICLMAVLLLVFSPVSFAKLTLTPSVGVKETYNDNIYLDSSDEEDDFITTVTPKIELDYSPNKSIDLNLDYRLDFRFYNENTDLNDTSLRESQNIDFRGQLRPLTRMYIDISDVYRRVQVDVKEKTATENDFKNMTDSNVFSISPYLVLPLTSSLTTKFGYQYVNIWYRDERSVDSEGHTAFLTLSKKFTSRIDGSLKYTYYAYRPDFLDDQDAINKYNRHEGSVAVAYQLTSEFGLTGEVGEAWFDYKTLDDRSITFWNVGTDYRLRVTEDTSLRGGYGVYFRDSTASGVFKSYRADLNFESGKALKLTIDAYHTIDKYLDTERKDKITGAAMDITRPLSKRLSITLKGSWERQKFLPEDKEVFRYSAGGSLDYVLGRNIMTGIGYRYNRREAEIKTDEYKNNIAWIQARVTF